LLGGCEKIQVLSISGVVLANFRFFCGGLYQTRRKNDLKAGKEGDDNDEKEIKMIRRQEYETALRLNDRVINNNAL
jgi:hypothetical protein